MSTGDAAGLPVVVTAVDGNLKIVDEQIGGMARALGELLESPERRVRLGEAARAGG